MPARPLETKTGRGSLVARVRNSEIAAWLGQVGTKKRASTRNQFRAFARALFDFAVADAVIAKNPFDPKIIRKLITTTYTEVFGSNAESYERAQLAKAAAAEAAMSRTKPLKKAA